MKLTNKQCDYLNNRRQLVREVIKSKPEYGLISYHAELEAIQLVIRLHNLEMEKPVE